MRFIQTLPICFSQEAILKLLDRVPLLMRPSARINQQKCLVTHFVQPCCDDITPVFRSHQHIYEERAGKIREIIFSAALGMNSPQFGEVGKRERAYHGSSLNLMRSKP